MGMGPVPATLKALEKAGLTMDQMDLVELNEAFASQSIACIRELGMDTASVNVKGGAIALGHPLGCSGGARHNDAGSRDEEAQKAGTVWRPCASAWDRGLPPSWKDSTDRERPSLRKR